MKTSEVDQQGGPGTPGEIACPLCDSESIVTTQLTDSLIYGSGASAVTLKVELPVRCCADCDIEFIDHVGERLRHEAVCRHLGVLTPAEVRAVREQHGLSRSEFADLAGLDEARLALWERGGAIQDRASDECLRRLPSRRTAGRQRG